MKYIRTKTGEIYDIDDLYVCEKLNGKPYGVKDSYWVIYQESIIKQADTIEELCDEYIIVQSNGKYHTSHSNSFMKVYIKGFIKQTKVFENGSMVYIKDIVGAIWIADTKGIPTLKPVAKMKGILPNGEIDWELL